jgi:hypothetical protein
VKRPKDDERKVCSKSPDEIKSKSNISPLFSEETVG